MKKIVLFDTSCGSQNMGDYIICEAIEKEMKYLFINNFLVRYATHTPITHFYQNINRSPIYNYCSNADYKFLAGTNILQYGMLKFSPNLNVNIFNCSIYKNMILIGVGLDKNKTKMDLYTKILYKKILNKNFIHSVRDEETKKMLNQLGFKAINTGCPTIWDLTEEVCKKIPSNKSNDVIFTLTDYCKDRKKDQLLIDILQQKYRHIYFWVQGSGDLEYFKTFNNINNIQIINPNLESYKEVLNHDDIEYVGTRLHAGILAMKYLKRSIIIAVDNRTRDMKKTYNLVSIDRNELASLDKLIDSKFSTNIKINENAIKQWKSQFDKEE